MASISSGVLKFTTVSADTIESQTENEARAFVVTGEEIGTNQLKTEIEFPTDSGYAGIIFGYQSPNDYWMIVLDATNDKKRLYEVTNGTKTLRAEEAKTIVAGPSYTLSYDPMRGCHSLPNYTFTNGYPSGKVGLVSSAANVEFDYFYCLDNANNADMLGRWCNNTNSNNVTYDATYGDRLYLSNDWDTFLNPKLLRNVRLDKFQATFSLRRASATNTMFKFVFSAKDQNSYNTIYLYHYDSRIAPFAMEVVDGGPLGFVGIGSTTNMPDLTSSETLWVRVQNDGTNVTLKLSDVGEGIFARLLFPRRRRGWGGSVSAIPLARGRQNRKIFFSLILVLLPKSWLENADN